MAAGSELGIGFVGAGWMGRTLLARVVERDDTEVRALHQRDRTAAAAVLGDLGLPGDLWTPEFRAVVDDPNVDAVFLCGPNAHHGPQAIAALEAGKHVFCEKPCATSFADFIAEIELERARPGTVTLVDYILHFDDLERTLRSMVADGWFGTITQIQVNYRHPVNIDGPKRWKLAADLIGDAIGMGIVHALWAMVNAMAPQARPSSVFASSSEARVRPFEVDPIWNIQLEFDDGALGACLGNIDSGAGYDAYHGLFGTHGAFEFDSLADRPLKVRYRSAERTGDRWVYPLDRARCERDGFADLAWPDGCSLPDSGDVIEHQTAACVAHFVDCVKSGTASPLGFGSTRPVAEIGFAARMSAVLGRAVSLPLDEDAAAAFFAS